MGGPPPLPAPAPPSDPHTIVAALMKLPHPVVIEVKRLLDAAIQQPGGPELPGAPGAGAPPGLEPDADEEPPVEKPADTEARSKRLFQPKGPRPGK